MGHNKHNHKNKHSDKKDHKHDSHKHDSNGHGDHDHTEHHKMMIQDFRKRFWISLVITLPILVMSPMIQNVFDYEITFRFVGYVLFGLSTFVFFYGGWPFLTGLVDELN